MKLNELLKEPDTNLVIQKIEKSGKNLLRTNRLDDYIYQIGMKSCPCH